MKKYFLLYINYALFSLFIAIEVPAQKNPDLAITEIQLVEATRNPATGLHKIKVRVTIKNNGDAPSVTTSLKMMVQNQLLNLIAPPNKQPVNPWHQLGENQASGPVTPGQSFTAEYVFAETNKVVSTQRFNIGLLADAGNLIKEMNETDNRSADITNITPVDRTEYVAVTTGVQVSQQLVKQDTLVHSIGRADFHIEGKRKAVPADVFIDMNPHGITLKRMGVDMTTPIKAGLVAPLHLPAGAVIRKVEFNYILLQGGSSVPHLVLRSYYLDNNGGWGSNKPITSYWLNSPSLNTSTGYAVKSSVTDPGFNVPVNKKASQYFEILAGSASSTATPMESSWPASNPFFIWSINVYYTLN